MLSVRRQVSVLPWEMPEVEILTEKRYGQNFNFIMFYESAISQHNVQGSSMEGLRPGSGEAHIIALLLMQMSHSPGLWPHCSQPSEF